MSKYIVYHTTSQTPCRHNTMEFAGFNRFNNYGETVYSHVYHTQDGFESLEHTVHRGGGAWTYKTSRARNPDAFTLYARGRQNDLPFQLQRCNCDESSEDSQDPQN